MYKLGINFDEISDSLDTSIDVIASLGVKFGEVRTINKENYVFWDKNKIKITKQKILDKDINLIAAASPLFKWYKDPVENEIKHDSFGFNPRLSKSEKKNVIEAAIINADMLGIRKIRIFSELGKYNYKKSEFYTNELLTYALSIAEKFNIDLLIENEPVCKVHNKKQIIDLFENIDYPNLKLWLDIANLYEINEPIDEEFLIKIIHKVEYIHVKDFQRVNKKLKYVPAGLGEIPYVDIFKKIYSLKNYDIVVTVETHAKTKKKERSIESIIGTRKILDEAGVQYE